MMKGELERWLKDQSFHQVGKKRKRKRNWDYWGMGGREKVVQFWDWKRFKSTFIYQYQRQQNRWMLGWQCLKEGADNLISWDGPIESSRAWILSFKMLRYVIWLYIHATWIQHLSCLVIIYSFGCYLISCFLFCFMIYFFTNVFENQANFFFFKIYSF